MPEKQTFSQEEVGQLLAKDLGAGSPRCQLMVVKQSATSSRRAWRS